MIHTVRIDDTTVAGKRFMQDYSNVRKGISFEKPFQEVIIPDEYMNSDDFWAAVEKDTNDFCLKNGIL
jgi:hypothetical protein